MCYTTGLSLSSRNSFEDVDANSTLQNLITSDFFFFMEERDNEYGRNSRGVYAKIAKQDQIIKAK